MARPTTGCPIEHALLVLDGKWSVLIIRDLLSGPKRFSELRDSLQIGSPKTLTERLRILEHQGVLTRTVYAEVPPRVVYELTERGQSFRSVLEAMAVWGERDLVALGNKNGPVDVRQVMKMTLLAGTVAALATLGLAPSAMASYTGQIQAGTLKLTGDGASDRLVLVPNGTQLAVDVGADGTIDFAFDKGAFTAVAIAAGGGDDEVTLFAAAVNDKTVTIDGGAGNDTMPAAPAPRR